MNPSEAHAGSAMPNVLAAVPDSERIQVAEALTHFLVAQSVRQFQSSEQKKQDLTVGNQLYHSVGCVACHEPREEKTRELTPAETGYWQTRKRTMRPVPSEEGKY